MLNNTVSYPLSKKGIVLVAPYRNPDESTTMRGVGIGAFALLKSGGIPFCLLLWIGCGARGGSEGRLQVFRRSAASQLDHWTISDHKLSCFMYGAMCIGPL